MKTYKISKTLYCRECILKIIYKWSDKYNITISEEENNYIIQIFAKNDTDIFNWDEFNSQLQEQQLRETLNKQFGSLRDSIYKKAFARFEE